MSDDSKIDSFLAAYQAKVDAGEPLISYFIEPPFDVKVENNLLHIDAPCMVAGGTNKAAVVRFTFSSSAVKGLKAYFAGLEVSESTPAPGTAIQ